MKSQVTQKTLKQGIHWQASNHKRGTIVDKTASLIIASAHFLMNFLGRDPVGALGAVAQSEGVLNKNSEFKTGHAYAKGLNFPPAQHWQGVGENGRFPCYFQGQSRAGSSLAIPEPALLAARFDPSIKTHFLTRFFIVSGAGKCVHSAPIRG
ncbi:hypothetical protein [Aeromonas rivipollensis]|uniref:hypothetical protein n=1 Tax=Aeromonas rivipollensis TaxID=948519 RepID=UPI0038CF46AC